MKSKDLHIAFLLLLVIYSSCLIFQSKKVSGQTLVSPSSSSGMSPICVACAEPLCSSGQVLSTPKDPCLDCPVCVDDCKCPSGMRFDGKNCLLNGERVACFLLYDPVCGCDGKTYSNSCFANTEGVKKFTRGDCTSSGSTVGLACKSDTDCPKRTCPNGSTYTAYNCLDGRCNQLQFFADPCQFPQSSSSSGGIIQRIALSKNFTGIWKGKVRETIPPASPIIALQLCVKEGKLEGTINQNGFIDNGSITSEDIISPNKVVVTVKDKNGKIETVTLKLQSFFGRFLSGTFSSGKSFIARKVSKFRSCAPLPCKNPCGPQGSIAGLCCSPGQVCKLNDPCMGESSCSAPTFFECVNDCSSRGSCRGQSGEELPCPEGTFCSGLPAYGCYPPNCPYPICCSADTRIRTTGVQKRIADIKEGDFVLTDGEKAVRVIKVSKTEVKNHKILKIRFNDGIVLEVSPSHPTSDGRLFKDLKIGDVVDRRVIVETKLSQYNYKYTYDILPDSPTGNYYANGILIGSTLKKK